MKVLVVPWWQLLTHFRRAGLEKIDKFDRPTSGSVHFRLRMLRHSVQSLTFLFTVHKTAVTTWIILTKHSHFNRIIFLHMQYTQLWPCPATGEYTIFHIDFSTRHYRRHLKHFTFYTSYSQEAKANFHSVSVQSLAHALHSQFPPEKESDIINCLRLRTKGAPCHTGQFSRLVAL